MLRTILTKILLLCVVALLAQLPGQDRNATDAQGRKQGPWAKSWASTGKLRYTGQFKDDKPLGQFKYYNEDGELTTTMSFVLNSKRASSKHFHPNGALMAKGNYIGQTKDSTWHYFDENGQLRKIETFVDGEIHGLVTTYFRDGSVADKSNFDHGVQVGDWKQYYIDGMKRAEAFFVKGEPEGIMAFFYENGKPEIKGKYKTGKKHGAWIYYNEDGSVHMQMLYEHGEFVKSSKENGVFKDYYDDEQLKNEVTWKGGQKNGPFTEYFNNGVWVDLTTKPDPTLGIEGGEAEKVLEGQTVRMKGVFKNDKLHGVVKTMNEKGKVVKEETYIEGVLQ